MNLDKKTSKRILVLVAISLSMIWVMQRLTLLPQFVSTLLGFFSPLLIGIMIAFVVNLPMRFIEKKLFSREWKHGDKIRLKVKRPLSMLMAFMVIIGVMVAIIFLVVPDLANTVVSFTQQLPQAIRSIQKWVEELSLNNPELMQILEGSNITFNDLVQRFLNWLNATISTLASSAFGWISGLVNGFVNFFLGFVFSIYFLLMKERIVRQIKQVAYAALPETAVDRTVQLSALVNHVFSRFIGGQGLEAIILSSLIFVGMNIFSFPYPLTISVLVAVGALIPIFGAVTAGALGFLLIFVESPIQAVWFIVMLMVTQNIDGNFIYPRVVGKSVGLPSIFVFLSVTFGSKLFGFVGLLLGVPTVTVIYILMRSWSSKRVQDKEIPPEKLNFRQSGENHNVYDESASSTRNGRVKQDISSAVGSALFGDDEDEDGTEQLQESLLGEAEANWRSSREASVRSPHVSPKEEAEHTDFENDSTAPGVRKFTARFDLDKVEKELAEEDAEAARIRQNARHPRKNRD